MFVLLSFAVFTYVAYVFLTKKRKKGKDRSIDVLKRLMPPKRPPPPKETPLITSKDSLPADNAGKMDEKMKAAMDKFAAELNKDSDDENTHDTLTEKGDQKTNEENASELSDAEKELLKDELKKTEDEINTLRQVLNARQKHAAELRRKLGISPLSEFTADLNHSIQHVKESQAYQKTSEVVAGTADTVRTKWNDMRNSSIFKSFESKLGVAYNNARMAASTSIDQLSGHVKPTKNDQMNPSSG